MEVLRGLDAVWGVQAVDLVDDDQLDSVVLDVAEHPLEFGTLGGFGAFTSRPLGRDAWP